MTNSRVQDHPDWTSLPGVFKSAGWLALGSGKAFHPMLPPAYDGNRSWSAEALPYFNPCFDTADDPHPPPGANSRDGGLPCFFCPIDIAGKLDKKINVSVANEFCAVDVRVGGGRWAVVGGRWGRGAVVFRPPVGCSSGYDSGGRSWVFGSATRSLAAAGGHR